jgi:hypothetical protein
MAQHQDDKRTGERCSLSHQHLGRIAHNLLKGNSSEIVILPYKGNISAGRPKKNMLDSFFKKQLTETIILKG